MLIYVREYLLSLVHSPLKKKKKLVHRKRVIGTTTQSVKEFHSDEMVFAWKMGGEEEHPILIPSMHRNWV